MYYGASNDVIKTKPDTGLISSEDVQYRSAESNGHDIVTDDVKRPYDVIVMI